MSAVSSPGLSDVFVECRLPADGGERYCEPGDDAMPCLALYRVRWLRTLPSTDSRCVLCHFRAPDAEAVRLALRRMQIGIGGLWVDAQSWATVRSRNRSHGVAGRA